MSILIKGMEMPQSCWRCKLKVGFSACGLVTDHKDGGLFYRVHNENSRPDWCPLVPLPEKHGDLIDRDALGDFPYNISFCDEGDIENWIANAPTIIPAEGGPDDVRCL